MPSPLQCQRSGSTALRGGGARSAPWRVTNQLTVARCGGRCASHNDVNSELVAGVPPTAPPEEARGARQPARRPVLPDDTGTCYVGPCSPPRAPRSCSPAAWPWPRVDGARRCSRTNPSPGAMRRAASAASVRSAARWPSPRTTARRSGSTSTHSSATCACCSCVVGWRPGPATTAGRSSPPARSNASATTSRSRCSTPERHRRPRRHAVADAVPRPVGRLHGHAGRGRQRAAPARARARAAGTRAGGPLRVTLADIDLTDLDRFAARLPARASSPRLRRERAGVVPPADARTRPAARASGC